jgi:glycosyltransferase involved in cell wall biosynthesis
MRPTRPFRILQVASGMRGLVGGTEKHVLDISTALAHRGHAVSLMCPREGPFSHRVGELGLPRVAFEMRGAHDWKQLPGLIRALAGSYDVVHTHLPQDYIAPALVARMKRIPAIVMTRHMPNRFASLRNAYVCSNICYDRIIAVSCFLRTVLVESGARPDRVDVVHNGIVPVIPDPGAGLRLRDEFRIPRDAILIAAAGRMSSGKGFDVLLKAVGHLSSNGVSVYCVIFGAGTLLQELRTLASDLRIESCIRLPGFRSDVHDLWRTADIAVVPSVDPESFSYAAIEALSAGCAVIASRIGALPEVLSDSSAIFTVPADVKSIAVAIWSLVSRPELRMRMQQAARLRAGVFTLDATVSGIERVYASVLKRQCPFSVTLEPL